MLFLPRCRIYTYTCWTSLGSFLPDFPACPGLTEQQRSQFSNVCGNIKGWGSLDDHSLSVQSLDQLMDRASNSVLLWLLQQPFRLMSSYIPQHRDPPRGQTRLTALQSSLYPWWLHQRPTNTLLSTWSTPLVPLVRDNKGYLTACCCQKKGKAAILSVHPTPSSESPCIFLPKQTVLASWADWVVGEKKSRKRRQERPHL